MAKTILEEITYENMPESPSELKSGTFDEMYAARDLLLIEADKLNNEWKSLQARYEVILIRAANYGNELLSERCGQRAAWLEDYADEE